MTPDQEGHLVIPGTGGLVPLVCARPCLIGSTLVGPDPEVGLLTDPVGGVLGLEGGTLQGSGAPEL